MTWPFENDTSAVVRRLSNARLRQHHFRNRLIGVIIFMAAAMMAFVNTRRLPRIREFFKISPRRTSPC